MHQDFGFIWEVNVSVRSLGYDSENLDRIICYFMRTVLHLQVSGVEDLPLENGLIEPWKTFLDKVMNIFLASTMPELSRLLLETEYDTAMHRVSNSAEIILGLQLIKEFAWHIRYDEDYYCFLLSTDNIWGNTALEYASLTFYPNLPEDIKNKYHIAELIRYVPEHMFRLEDY